MNRITHLDPESATGAAKTLFDGVKAKLGMVPNLMRVMGNAPAALSSYLSFGAALAEGSFDAKLREQIALAVAESNQCGYCLSAHTFIGRKLGLTDHDIAAARHANASSPRTDAILKLARSIVVLRGEIDDAGLDHARTAGLSDGDIIETVANVAVNIFTNYVNHIARTTVDFPEVKPGNGVAPSACACS